MCNGFVACNVFNPSGDGDPDSPESWVVEGTKCLQKKEYKKAEDAFNHALALDSTCSGAWDGWLEVRSKFAEDSSGLATDSLASLLWHEKDSVSASKASSMPFMKQPLPVKNQIYQYVSRIAAADSIYLARFVYRGTAFSDSLNFKDHVRKQVYLGLRSAVSVLKLCDFDGDGVINGRDTGIVNFCSDANGGLLSGGSLFQSKSMALDSLVADSVTGTIDTQKVVELNRYLQTLDKSMGQLKPLVQAQGADSAQWGKINTFLSTRGKDIVFYQGSDQKDNDGDGCVDEEIPDGYDNDGDEFIDEDFRVGSRMLVKRYDSLDNKSGEEKKNALKNSLQDSLAITAPFDGVDASRLVGIDGVSGSASSLSSGRDTTSALQYVEGADWGAHPGLFKKYLPYVDPKNPKHWKFAHEDAFGFSLKKDSTFVSQAYPGLQNQIPGTMDSLDPVTLKARFGHKQLTQIRLTILAISDPHDRVVLGKHFVGGCWMDVVMPSPSASSRFKGQDLR